MSEGNDGVGPEQGGGAMVKKPETPLAESSPATPVTQLSSSFEKSTGPVQTSATPSETKPASQTAQAQSGEPQKADASKPTDNFAKEQSSNEIINMTQVLQQEFNLQEEQLNKLQQLAKERGITLDQFSKEDLGNKEKMKQVLDLLENDEMKLNDQQKATLEKINQELQQADQPLTSEQMRAKITERKQQIISRIQQLQQKQQSGQVLTQEEQEEFNQNQQTLAALTEMESRVGEISQDQSETSKTQRKQAFLEKAPTYIKYAGFGLAALFFIFIWRGLAAEGGGQGRGMMG
jgi:hypothetical protein